MNWISRLAVLVFLLPPALSVAAENDGASAKANDPDHAAKMARGLELFKKDVRQVLVGRCVKCHGGETAEAEFDLATRKALLKGGAEGPAVELGKGKASRLYRLVAHLEEPHMPEDGAKLDDRAIAAIAKWIDLGAPYDKPLVEKEDDPLAWTRRKIDDGARQFWAFQPLRIAQPPRLADDAWSRTDVDRFVLAKLRENGMQPNSPASRRKLIRRAFFDLIGLPPSPEEVAKFIDDDDPRAYEKLIDRLLDSPHYGERWGRHWLDIARFGESHGFEQDYDRPHAYHFRDFVIKALNQDMPYDQFVRWQLAGDEIASEDPLAMTATGFLGAGVFPTQLTEKEFEPARYDELDDMVGTMGTAMLGLTVGCARCHDHKFDPIPQADYYRMIATFTTAIRSHVELEIPAKGMEPFQKQHRPLVEALEKYERGELIANAKSWIEKLQPEDAKDAVTWHVLNIEEARSEGGATLKRLEDGSLLAGGTSPKNDRYTLVVKTALKNITSVRLEALAHESFVRKGPGRGSNGNFALSDFKVIAAPASGDGNAVNVKLTNARATFEQNKTSLSVAGSIDDDPVSGWAVDPQFGKDHAAAFDFVTPVGFEGGTQLTFNMHFNNNVHHSIGRPRISISTVASPPLKGSGQLSPSNADLQRLAKGAGGFDKLDVDNRRRIIERYKQFDRRWIELNAKVQQHWATRPKGAKTTVLVTSEGLKPIKHHADGRGFPHFYKETHFLKRGDTSQKQGVARQGFLQVLATAADGGKQWTVAREEISRTSYRRSAMANWITDTEHGAGRLSARVIVNRLWQHHLGRGIVATANDFGFQGERPSHPELLDWLAARLIAPSRDGSPEPQSRFAWRLKPLHKLMMTSAVYMQSADFDEDDSKIDPAKRLVLALLAPALEAEVIRDAMLATSGQLDRTSFGPGTLDESMKRRSIYFMVKRSKLIPMMQIFDSPEPLVSVGNRPSTTIAPQALMFMNNPHVRGYARGFAQRLGPAADKALADAVRQGYLFAVAREPDEQELRDNVGFLRSQIESYEADKTPNSKELALADFCQVLMCLNEFIYVD